MLKKKNAKKYLKLLSKGTKLVVSSYLFHLKRFQLLNKRLNKDSLLKEKYSEFINEYINLKYMKEVKHIEDIC